jgi:hypothetical protein
MARKKQAEESKESDATSERGAHFCPNQSTLLAATK